MSIIKGISKKLSYKKISKKQQHRQIRVGLMVLLVLVLVFIYVAYQDYCERPGVLTPDDVEAIERTTNSITLQWDSNRNTDVYYVYYKKSGSENKDWSILELKDDKTQEKDTIKIKDLEEGTRYRIVVRADNKERKGFVTKGKIYSTKSNQKIVSKDSYSKLKGSKSFYIQAKAKTAMEFSSDNKKIATVNKTSGKVVIKSAGKATITIKARENNYYVPAEKKIQIIVLDSKKQKLNNAKADIIYQLEENDCEIERTITGVGNIHVPQGLAYTGDKYIVAYGTSGAQRIVTFDIDGNEKEVSVPSVNMGHPNGFTYCNKTGLCYSVRGWSRKVITYNPKSDEYGETSLSYGCSGIAYDRAKKRFYTSSRTAMREYSGDGKFNHIKAIGVVKHSEKVYTQDCGAYAGILIHCLSGSSKHATNYIDLYDMEKEIYLGSFECDLGEIESVIVDEDGYLEIMANQFAKEDYIYRTPINIGDLTEE